MDEFEFPQSTLADGLPKQWMRALFWLPIIYLAGIVLFAGVMFLNAEYQKWEERNDQLVQELEQAADEKNLPRMRELNDQLEERMGQLIQVRNVLFCLMPFVLGIVPLYLWMTWQITYLPEASIEIWARRCTFLMLGVFVAALLGSPRLLVKVARFLTALVIQAGHVEAFAKICRATDQFDLQTRFQRSEWLLRRTPFTILMLAWLVSSLPGGMAAIPYLKLVAIAWFAGLFADNAMCLFALRYRLTRPIQWP